MSRVPLAAALALAVLAGGRRTAAVRAHDPVPTTPTFAADVRGILAARCTTCHAAGGSAPMPLTTAEEVRPWAAATREQVLNRRMPKWHAARGYGAFVNDPTLTPHEQAIVIGWIDAGMPEGVPRGAAAPRPAAGFAIGTTGDDARRVFVRAGADVGWLGGGSAAWITGWAFSPGDPLISAAVISVDRAPIGSWVAGDRPTRLPPGLAFRGGGRIRVDLRRRAAAAQERPFVPRASVLTLLTTVTTPAQRAWTEQIACGALRSGPPGRLLAVRPLLDRREIRMSVTRPGAPASIVGWFRDFDPLYPRTYWLVRPIEMGSDTSLAGDGPCRVELTLAPSGYGTSMTNAAVVARPPRWN
ncbi:MAG TPA: hypothetical protein VFK57_09375 [Vicinamibacterales bacterium]|nr:hypothetical protein [Vicinamibacterales bacterium]